MNYFKRKIRALLSVIESRSKQPVKGDLLQMNLGDGAKLYRVLKTHSDDTSISNNQVVIMGMEDLNYNNQYYWSTYSSTTCDDNFIDGVRGVKYNGSTLDTYLNQTYYNTLTTAISNNVIIDKLATQDQYLKGKIWPKEVTRRKYKYIYNNTEESYIVGDFGTLPIGTRHIRSLSLTDILEYFNPEEGETPSSVVLTRENMEEFLYNNTQQLGISDPYLMTSCVLQQGKTSDYYYYAERDAFYINSLVFSTSICDNKYHKAARPVFVINLLNIEYSIL